MLECSEFFELLSENELTYFTGVPDSTFKGWMSFLDDMDGSILTNRISAIERDSIAMAAGYYIATGKIGVVYMQNSGLGNTVNPLTSLADPSVYNIPMLMMIGWRGEPGRKDEPQHKKMGEITLALLDTLDIKYGILPDSIEEAAVMLKEARSYMDSQKGIFALVIKEGIIKDYKKTGIAEKSCELEMKREEAMGIILDALDSDSVIVSTTGKTSRELFEYREARQQGHGSDFMMVGAMGLASSFACEVALQRPEEKVYVFDGDGALLMSEGALSTIGFYRPVNFHHILFDNEAHESTGGQPTTSPSVDFEKLALSHGYKSVKVVMGREELKEAIKGMESQKSPSMLVVKVEKGSRKDLGRPTTTPIENRDSFMRRLNIKL